MLKKSKILAIVLMFSCCIGAFSSGFAATNNIQTQIKQAKDKLTKTKAKEKSALGQLVQTQRELNQISSSLKKINSQMGNTEKKIGQIETELHKAENSLKNINGEIDDKRTVLNVRLLAIYKHGYQSYLEILFESKDFAEFISRFEMLGRFVNNDLDLLRKLQGQLTQVAQVKKQIASKREELERERRTYAKLQQQNASKQSQWLTKEKSQQRQLQSIQSDRKKLESALDELEETSRRMEAELQKKLDKNAPQLGSGKMIWPVRGRISSPYGYRMHPILKQNRFHSGIDIAVAHGTPILAADSGVIIFSGVNGGYGNMITIDHGAGLSTTYAHCSVLLVKVKDKVTKGQRIALVGSTGMSTGPHLHFEVRKQGKPDDPNKYL